MMQSFRSLVRAHDGATALEFGIIALPFFVLTLALFEVCLSTFASSVLEAGAVSVARQIRTGEIQAGEVSETEFRTMLCDRVAPLLACDERLALDVRTYTSFNNVQFAPSLDENGNFSGDTQFSPGAAGDVVVVRAFYSWPMMTPVGYQFDNMSGGYRLLEAAVTFRNEPFGSALQ